MTLTPDQLASLADEFPRESVHWRAQTMNKDGNKAMALAYIDARDVMDRLDGRLGPENWQDRYEETPKGRIICTLSIRVGDEWVSKSDGAGETDVEGSKGALSDALKRAAVKWGVGRYLYSLASPWVPCEKGTNGKFRKFTDDPWKYVRGPAPANDGGLPKADQAMIDEIGKCDTMPLLDTWLANNRAKALASPNATRITAAWNAQKAAVETMDRQRA